MGCDVIAFRRVNLAQLQSAVLNQILIQVLLRTYFVDMITVHNQLILSEITLDNSLPAYDIEVKHEKAITLDNLGGPDSIQ